MKKIKNCFSIGKLKKRLILFSEEHNLLLNEIKRIIEFFEKDNIILFNGFFREQLPNKFNKFASESSDKEYYILNNLKEFYVLLNNDFINQIVNLNIYFFKKTSCIDNKKPSAALSLENHFCDCLLEYDSSIYNKGLVDKMLKSL